MKKLLLLLLPVIIVLVFVVLSPKLNLEQEIKILGLIFQLIGIATVIYGIDQRLASHKGKNLFSYIGEIINRSTPNFLKRKSAAIVGKTATTEISTTEGEYLVNPKKHFKEIHDVVEYFEGEIERINYKTTKTEERLTNLIKQLRDLVKIQRREIEKLENDFKEKGVSGVGIDFIGAMCLIIGIILSTIPEIIIQVLL